MKNALFLAAVLALCFAPTLPAAQTAQGRMYSISVKMSQGVTPIYNGGFQDWMRVNSSGYPEGDDELVPWDLETMTELYLPGTITYVANLWVYDDLYDMVWAGSLNLNLPDVQDLNNNRYPDFFEVSQGINANSVSSYFSLSSWGSGTVEASWTRAAGSSTGTCTIVLQNWRVPFLVPFEILEYTGPVSYTSAATKVSGSVNLARNGNPSDFYRGPFEMVKAPGDPNSLTIQPSFWTNATETLSLTNHLFTREASWPTNYAGLIHFDRDGDPWTFQTWRYWVLSISDPNDTDGDGIPNFADDPVTVLPRAPRISLDRGPSGLQLTVRGDVGFTHEVLESSDPAGQWTMVTSVPLTSDPQVVTLPAPAGTRFYRVRARAN